MIALILLKRRKMRRRRKPRTNCVSAFAFDAYLYVRPHVFRVYDPVIRGSLTKGVTHATPCEGHRFIRRSRGGSRARTASAPSHSTRTYTQKNPEVNFVFFNFFLAINIHKMAPRTDSGGVRRTKEAEAAHELRQRLRVRRVPEGLVFGV